MKELNILGYILTYIAFFMHNHKKISLKVNFLENMNIKIILLISMLPLVLVKTTKSVEQMFTILSYTFGILSLKYIVNAEKPKLANFAHNIFLAGMLLSVYNYNIFQNYLVFIYLLYGLYILLLVSNDVTNINSVVSESVLTHLIFFFTKS